ncbi:uncharacterized protein LOC114416060 [Glycine soja]|uniref:uncharacterized protein LOC114416060 n=1 Tax=Glycine soja TaxID=3848 RepID=UPI00103C157B|nr:uncharacterized protein LOC114416060 [Glycine soja]
MAEESRRVTLEDYSNAIRLSLFSFSLAGEAKRWLHSFKGNSLKSWDEVVEKFLKKYFPESKIAEDGLRPQSKQLLDASAGGKIKMKTPEEAMDLIKSMAASDIAILRDRAHIPTKKSLLELTSQDALLAQNKLLSKQLEVPECTICGGAHESGCCIPNEEQIAHKANYMGNQPRGNFNTSGFPGFQNNQQYQQ